MEPFEAWRVELAPGDRLVANRVDWTDALVLVERGRLRVECLGGEDRTFAAGDMLVLAWLPLRTLANPGPGAVSLLAVRRRQPIPIGFDA